MPSPAPVESSEAIFLRLARVRTGWTMVRDQAPSASRRLRANIEVQRRGDTVIFTERGAWEDGRRTLNALRWSVGDNILRLEHLRHGENAPVALVQFGPIGPTRLASLQPHKCAADVYSASLRWSGRTLALRWRVHGPAKGLTITTLYR